MDLIMNAKTDQEKLNIIKRRKIKNREDIHKKIKSYLVLFSFSYTFLLSCCCCCCYFFYLHMLLNRAHFCSNPWVNEIISIQFLSLLFFQLNINQVFECAFSQSICFSLCVSLSHTLTHTFLLLDIELRTINRFQKRFESLSFAHCVRGI